MDGAAPDDTETFYNRKIKICCEFLWFSFHGQCFKRKVLESLKYAVKLNERGRSKNLSFRLKKAFIYVL